MKGVEKRNIDLREYPVAAGLQEMLRNVRQSMGLFSRYQ